jgi:ribose 5-phosphate isomerase RpiB
MRIHIGSDHAGLELKAELVKHLTSNGHDVTDLADISMTHSMITRISVFRQRKRLQKTQHR